MQATATTGGPPRCRGTRWSEQALVRALAVFLALLAGGCGEANDPPADRPESELPPVSVEEVVLDLKAEFDAGRVRVLAQDATWPLATWPAASLDRSEVLGTLAADQAATVLHARAESAFELDTPVLGPGAHLLARTFVYPVERRDPERADPYPVRFVVRVDGVEVASLSSAYVRDTDREHPFDQLMRTLSVDLSAHEGRSVRLSLQTTRDGATGPADEHDPSAEPCWWYLGLTQTVARPRQRASGARPNLLMVCADTLAAKRLAPWGYARQSAPRLSAWAAGGLRFARAWSGSSWTLPSTATLFTGLPPNTHGVLGDARSYLMESLSTWAEGLSAQGMEGAAFVANPLLAHANNFHQGFATWVNEDGDQGPGTADAERLVDGLLTWLDAQPADGRWFAYLHAMDPHAPYGAPGAARERYTEGYQERRDFGGHLPGRLQNEQIPPFTPEEQAHVVDLYDGEVAYLDAQFGRLLDGLAERGLLEHTIVAFTADHGEELFEYGRLGHGYALNEPMLHVPLVIAGPGVPAGVVERPVSTAGLANAWLRLGGAHEAPGAARSLLPLAIDDRPVFALTRTALFGPRRVLVSVRDAEGRKLVVEVADEGGTGSATAVGCTLHRLEGAHDESHPIDPDTLSDDERERYDALTRAALAWYDATAAARPDDVQHEVDVSDALRGVGYLGSGEDDG